MFARESSRKATEDKTFARECSRRATGDRTFVKGDGGQNVRKGRRGTKRSRGDIREGRPSGPPYKLLSACKLTSPTLLNCLGSAEIFMMAVQAVQKDEVFQVESEYTSAALKTSLSLQEWRKQSAANHMKLREVNNLWWDH